MTIINWGEWLWSLANFKGAEKNTNIMPKGGVLNPCFVIEQPLWVSNDNDDDDDNDGGIGGGGDDDDDDDEEDEQDEDEDKDDEDEEEEEEEEEEDAKDDDGCCVCAQSRQKSGQKYTTKNFVKLVDRKSVV